MITENRKIQYLTLNTLKVFMSYCDKYNLTYYFSGGALIGVVRHRGFIPWDDDIDIVMPRDDFDRFHYLLESDMPKGFGICNRFTNSDWHFAMSQFVDLESEIEIDLAREKRKTNIWIDIFPLDGLPTNYFARWVHVKNILLHRYLIQLSHINTQVDAHKKRPFVEKMILKISSWLNFGSWYDSNKILQDLDNVLHKYNFYDSEYSGNMLGRYREKEVLMTKWFGSPTIGVFEENEVNIPEYTHEILSSMYGNYMELPPEKDRVAHNVKLIKSRIL